MNMNKVEDVITAVGSGSPLDCAHWRRIALRYARRTQHNPRVSEAYRTRARIALLGFAIAGHRVAA